MSFTYRRRRRSSPKIDLQGTSQKRFPGSEKVLYKFTLTFLFDGHDLNQRIKSLENPKYYILLIRIS